jgi:hypothetical protein
VFGAQLSTCIVPPVFAAYSLSAEAHAVFEGAPDEALEFDRRMQCYAATLANASALGARAETLIRAGVALAQAEGVFVAVADATPSAAGSCAEARLNAGLIALEVIVERLATAAELVLDFHAATR